ncbi:hypothetical protein BpHYR1_035441 [Brachionus plicatilis]|uniref:Uncharacterized protein n=1 Tax=Brachionus plicatilis TaxID=10195 RepID=A0A3M7SR57_BRAPC|nr:hypothetical protein BpHYR1_035441 [Brachionus plicatilis]
MIENELLSYLGLIPKDSARQENGKTAEIKPNKPNRKLTKFLTKIPFTILYSHEHLAKLTNSFELTKFDSSFRKIKYIGFDYEKYINNDTYVQLNERYPKRKLTSKLENTFARSVKKAKKTPRICLVMTKKISFEQILDNFKISKETQNFIHRKMSRKSEITKDFVSENSDQAISIESQLGDQLNQSHLSLYNNENPIVDQFNKANNNHESSLWFNYFHYNECENFLEHSKNIKPLTQQFNSYRRCKKIQKPNKPLVNLNENFELIDLTNDII